MSWKAILFGVVFGLVGYYRGRHDLEAARAQALAWQAVAERTVERLDQCDAETDLVAKTADGCVQQLERCPRARP